MPVLTLQCPQCRHEFKGMVFGGSKPPELWLCGSCGSDRAVEKPGVAAEPHPWDVSVEELDAGRPVRLRHSPSCPCCF